MCFSEKWNAMSPACSCAISVEGSASTAKTAFSAVSIGLIIPACDKDIGFLDLTVFDQLFAGQQKDAVPAMLEIEPDERISREALEQKFC